MKFLHTADLHIGRRLPGGYSLEEDQQHMLHQILDYAKEADAVLIAGDLFDKSQPSQSALRMAGAFLSDLASLKKPVFLISGNHDGAEQIAYCREILRTQSVFVSPAYDEQIISHTLHDAFGPLTVWLVPFVRPYQVRHVLKKEDIQSYQDALGAVLSGLPLDRARRNVLLMHQLVLGGEQSDSEETSIGSLESISPSLLSAFDYVALGHLHKPQNISPAIRYAGSPIAYSLSEEHHHKSVSMVELSQKGQIEITPLPIVPVHPLRTLKGTLKELMRTPSEDYIYAVLSDDIPPMDAGGALKSVFPRLIGYEMLSIRAAETLLQDETFDETKTLKEHFADFYAAQHAGRALDKEQLAYISHLEEKYETH